MNCLCCAPGARLTTNERRRRQRFPLELGLRYHAAAPASSAVTGMGRTENISSCGLLFRCAVNLEVGSHIALEVDLPETTSGEQVKLYASGHVIRSGPSAVAVVFGHSKFGAPLESTWTGQYA
jgi:hypothetical protein